MFYGAHYLNRYYLFSDNVIADLWGGRQRASVKHALAANTAVEAQARLNTLAAENVTALKAVLGEV